GGLIASGWHTCAMMMRVMVDSFIDGEASLGSPGLGPIRWKLPVRPGDVLRVRARVVDSKPSQSKPDRGTITFEVDVLNQNGGIVMTVENWLAIMRTRPAAAHPSTSSG
ncbi:MAG: dehydratase, partial [Candidatus Eremiobacteraeota bacterium]|nr:dehydratase [Candidatus Eremiobacteraeota bacterium]